MESLNYCISEYTGQLRKGIIQKAYKGIISFMSKLKKYIGDKHPEYSPGSLYMGHMDMTYFAITPMELKNRSLKIAIVYLHEQNRIEIWLCGSNRKIQSEYIRYFGNKKIDGYKLSQAEPGVDSIIESLIVEQPDFDNADELMKIIEEKTVEFANQIVSLLHKGT